MLNISVNEKHAWNKRRIYFLLVIKFILRHGNEFERCKTFKRHFGMKKFQKFSNLLCKSSWLMEVVTVGNMLRKIEFESKVPFNPFWGFCRQFNNVASVALCIRAECLSMTPGWKNICVKKLRDATSKRSSLCNSLSIQREDGSNHNKGAPFGIKLI